MAKTKNKKKTSFAGATAVAAIVFAVVAVIAIAMWNQSRRLQNQIDDYDKKITEINQMIETEQERAVSLEEKKKYVQTKQYTEQVAKDKFNLVYPDEVILKRKDK